MCADEEAENSVTPESEDIEKDAGSLDRNENLPTDMNIAFGESQDEEEENYDRCLEKMEKELKEFEQEYKCKKDSRAADQGDKDIEDLLDELF